MDEKPYHTRPSTKSPTIPRPGHADRPKVVGASELLQQSDGTASQPDRLALYHGTSLTDSLCTMVPPSSLTDSLCTMVPQPDRLALYHGTSLTDSLCTMVPA
ncbi:hypothetical protein ACOMHN_012008 [Nucella lapillus]